MAKIQKQLQKHSVHAGITGVGHYVPDRVLTNADLEKMVDTSDEWIVTRSGIRERRIADEGMATSDMCVAAAKDAMKQAGVAAEELDLILVATVTGDYRFPSTSCVVQDKLGATKAAAMDIGAGCTGFVYGLATAAAFIESGRFKKILLVGAEMLSCITNWEDRSTCVLFGDGAGAAILEPCGEEEGILATYLGADGSVGEHLIAPAGGSALELTEERLRNKEDKLYMNGSEVFKVAVRYLEHSVVRVLEELNATPEDIDVLIPHQANRRIVEAVNRRLRLPEEKLVMNLDRFGNTSAASIPIALSEAVADGRVKKGDLVVMSAFGAGMTWGAVGIRWAGKEV